MKRLSHCSQNLLSCTVAERTRSPTGVLIWCSWNSADSSVTMAWCTTLALLLSLASGLLASPTLHWLQWGIPTILHTSQTTISPTPAAWLSSSGCRTLCITCGTGIYGALFNACSRQLYLYTHKRACARAHATFRDIKPVLQGLIFNVI